MVTFLGRGPSLGRNRPETPRSRGSHTPPSPAPARTHTLNRHGSQLHPLDLPSRREDNQKPYPDRLMKVRDGRVALKGRRSRLQRNVPSIL